MIFLQPEELLLIFISCISALLEKISFRFCLSENVFISPFILKDIFTGFRILGRKCFSFYPFSTLKTILLVIFSLHCLWWEASFHLVPLYMTCPFSLAAFDIFSLFLVFKFDMTCLSWLVFSGYHLCFSAAVSSISRTPGICVLTACTVPQVIVAFCPYWFFSLCFKLNDSFWLQVHKSLLSLFNMLLISSSRSLTNFRSLLGSFLWFLYLHWSFLFLCPLYPSFTSVYT